MRYSSIVVGQQKAGKSGIDSELNKVLVRTCELLCLVQWCSEGEIEVKF
jgi:hypothetical protein